MQQAILGHLISLGARLAEPGEFTQRAFVSGKMDLSQAEAVADLISADSAASHKLAFSQLRGAYAQRIRELRAQMMEIAALLELELDFSEEEVEFADRSKLLGLVKESLAECDRLADSFKYGNAFKKGIPVAIVGAVNSGKSTLLNILGCHSTSGLKVRSAHVNHYCNNILAITLYYGALWPCTISYSSIESSGICLSTPATNL